MSLHLTPRALAPGRKSNKIQSLEFGSIACTLPSIMRLFYTLGATALFASRILTAATSQEEIVAKVNGDIITRSELEKQKDPDALRDKLDQLLLISRAHQLDLKVDAEIARTIARAQAYSKIGDPDKFHQWVYERFGMTFEDWKQQETDSELKRRVVSQEVGSHITIHREELEAYYDQHKSDFIREEQVFLREILVSTGDGSPSALTAAEKRAKDLVARLRKGEKFLDLVRIYSDAETAATDGELGAFTKGQLTDAIEDVVFKARKSEITDPIRIPAGFEILKVEDRHVAGLAPLDDVRDEIMEKLYPLRLEPELRKYLTHLRENAFIQIREGYVDSGAAPGKDTTWKDIATLKPETVTKEEVRAHSKR